MHDSSFVVDAARKLICREFRLSQDELRQNLPLADFPQINMMSLARFLVDLERTSASPVDCEAALWVSSLEELLEIVVSALSQSAEDHPDSDIGSELYSPLVSSRSC